MKKARFEGKLFLLTFVVMPLFFLTSVVSAKDLAIGSDRTGLRSRPSILSKPTSFLKYGAPVQVLEVKGRWSKINSSGQRGWVLSSTIGDGESILKDIGKGEFAAQEAYQDEVASAGKGFSAEFEKMSKENNPKLNYKDVDRIEKVSVPVNDIFAFSRRGKLKSSVLGEEK